MLRAVNEDSGYCEYFSDHYKATMVLSCGHIVIKKFNFGEIVPDYVECEECQKKTQAQVQVNQ